MEAAPAGVKGGLSIHPFQQAKHNESGTIENSRYILAHTRVLHIQFFLSAKSMHILSKGLFLPRLNFPHCQYDDNGRHNLQLQA
jgi:hypothetical protein